MIKNYLTYINENRNLLNLRAGDKVICVKPNGALVKDKVYTLTGVWFDGTDTMCAVDGDEGWFLSRFIPADPDFLKKMEKIREKDYIEHMDIDPYGEEEWTEISYD